MTSFVHRAVFGAAVVLAASAPFSQSASAADAVADFYKDKTVTITVGYGTGGGYDTMTRFFARHVGKHIPGNPNIIVQNMPGAPRSTNHLYNVAPKDGTALGVFAAATALEPLFGSDQAQFETEKFEWIGSLDRDVNSCAVWKGAGQNIKTLPDLIAAKKEVIFGASTAAATSSQHAVFLKKMLKANLKVITGYEGTNAVKLAMQRGEMDAACGLQANSVRSAYMQEVQNGELNFFVQFGDKPVPLFGDATVLNVMLLNPDDRQIADLIFKQTELARPLAAPPGTPKERVATLRKAMLDTFKDPAMIAEAQKMGLDFNPISGEDVAEMFANFMKTPKELAKKAADYTQPN